MAQITHQISAVSHQIACPLTTKGATTFLPTLAYMTMEAASLPRCLMAALIVQVIIISSSSKCSICSRCRRSACSRDWPVREAEVRAKATGLLECLSEGLPSNHQALLANIGVRDRATGIFHGLLEVSRPDLRHFFQLILLHGLWVLCPPFLHLNVLHHNVVDMITIIARAAHPLANFGYVSAREALRVARQSVKVNLLRERGLAKDSLENLQARCLVGERNVNELIQAAWPEQRRVNDVGAVSGANNEDRLLGIHPVHLCEQLIEHAVSRSTSVPYRAASLRGNGVELVKEEDARGRAPSFVKNFPYICLALAKPHGEKLRALDRDEIGLALVCNGLGQKRLAAPWRPVEEHALGW
eukprot:SM000145S00791  [mRNA]  locus=s145:45317:47663:- [translate_table: standard]